MIVNYAGQLCKNVTCCQAFRCGMFNSVDRFLAGSSRGALRGALYAAGSCSWTGHLRIARAAHEDEDTACRRQIARSHHDRRDMRERGNIPADVLPPFSKQIRHPLVAFHLLPAVLPQRDRAHHRLEDSTIIISGLSRRSAISTASPSSTASTRPSARPLCPRTARRCCWRRSRSTAM